MAGIKELALIMIVFLVVFYGMSNFSNALFGTTIEVSPEITAAQQATYQQINAMTQKINEDIQKINSGEITEQIAGTFGLAFTGIFFIIIEAYTIIVSIPASMFEFINYVGATLAIPASIILLITSAITIVVIIAAIMFLTGRVL